jgi:hypothetical protein
VAGNNLPSRYKYDVFVSYLREPEIVAWCDLTIPHVKHWLREELGGREVTFFEGELSGRDGKGLSEAARDALVNSACLLPFWSPTYFYSAACYREWRSFVLRQELILERDKREHGLIKPIKIWDGEHFPPEARQMEQFDASKYTPPVYGFEKTKLGGKFLRRLVREYVPSLASAVRDAPSFEQGWPVDDSSPLKSPANSLRIGFD